MKRFGFAVIVIIFNLFVVSSSSFSFSSATEELEGILEIIMVTNIEQKTCEPLYSINVSGKRTQFSLPARVPPLSPGQPIKISGRWKEVSGKKSFHCRKITPIVIAPTAKKAVSSADNISDSDYLPRQDIVLGPQNVLVVCLNSPDTKDDSPVWTEETINDKISSDKHSLNAYWEACSIDKTGKPQAWLTCDVLDKGNWKTMPKNWAEYGYGSVDERNWRSEFQDDMIKLIDPEVDFSKSQYTGLIVFRAGKKWTYDWSTGGEESINR